MAEAAAVVKERWTFIPDVLEEHLEELGFLWSQRRADLRSADVTGQTMLDLEERIRARRDAVLGSAPRGYSLIEQALEADDPELVFAAGFSLLHLGSEQIATRVVDAFAKARGERFEALREALSHAPPTELGLRLVWDLLNAGVATLAVAAAEILVFHGALRLTPAQVQAFLTNEDARVRVTGWRLVGYLQAEVGPKLYVEALRAEEEAVRAASLEAGAWCRVAGVLAVVRQLARTPSPEHLHAHYLLAVLGSAEDVALLRSLAAAEALGPARFDVLGPSGLPQAVEWTLEAMVHPDPLTAAAAGRAFTALTGIDAGSDRKVTAQAADAFEAEFADEVTLPDPERARAEWAALAPRLRGATRIARGEDVGRPLDAATFHRLDMRSRWQLFLRSRFYGGWDGTPLELEIFRR